jgi:hypothetical protein
LGEDELAQELAWRLAGSPADGQRPQPDAAPPSAVVWVDDGSDAVVHLETLAVRLLDQILLASVELETDQTGRAPLVVALAVSGLDGPGSDAGLVAVTDDLPRGNGLLAARWGHVLQDAVWAALLTLAQDHATEQHYRPAGIVAVPGALHVRSLPPIQSGAPLH